MSFARLFFFAAAASTLFLPALAEKTGSDGWMITQVSEVLGEQTLWLKADAVKAVCKRTNVTVVCKAPDFQVVSYNEKTRCRSVRPLESYVPELHRMLAVTTGAGYSDIPMIKSATKMVEGLKHEYLMSDPAWEEKQRRRTIDPHEKMRTAVSARAVVTPSVRVDPRIALFLCRYYGLPRQRTFPLSFGFTNRKTKFVSLLETERIERALLKERNFAIPRGYRLVSNMADVLMNTNQQDDVDELFSGLSESYNRRRQSKNVPR